MICTVYSIRTGIEVILEVLKSNLPKGKISLANKDGFQIIQVSSKKGLFSSRDKLKFSYRERKDPGTPLHSSSDCTVSNNINGLYRFVNSLQSKNEKIKELFKLKIQDLNSEFSILQEEGETKNLKNIILSLANEFDAVLFVQPNAIISKARTQHFLNKDLELILDMDGNSEIDFLGQEIEDQYQSREKHYRENILAKLSTEQRERKLNNENFLRQALVKVNKFLPAIEDEAECKIRTVSEIAERVSVMAFINGFAIGYSTKEQVEKSLKDHGLWDLLTPKELDLLTYPTEKKKSDETWKCEGIWTLLWALKVVDDLGDPATLCDLGNIAQDQYPLIDPNAFITSMKSVRSKSEILDAADLYYRMDWTCVNAKMNGIELTKLHAGVVYERHYALNWLINYMGQDWDDVSCDT